jgi:hypothetical protein
LAAAAQKQSPSGNIRWVLHTTSASVTVSPPAITRVTKRKYNKKKIKHNILNFLQFVRSSKIFVFVLFCFVLVWFGLVWFGLVWFGLVCFALFHTPAQARFME